jgi:hypothetical protein
MLPETYEGPGWYPWAIKEDAKPVESSSWILIGLTELDVKIDGFEYVPTGGSLRM